MITAQLFRIGADQVGYKFAKCRITSVAKIPTIARIVMVWSMVRPFCACLALFIFDYPGGESDRPSAGLLA